jgi:hypothetical protein
MIAGEAVVAPDMVGIWNNRVKGVSRKLKKNVVGVISQV